MAATTRVKSCSTASYYLKTNAKRYKSKMRRKPLLICHRKEASSTHAYVASETQTSIRTIMCHYMRMCSYEAPCGPTIEAGQLPVASTGTPHRTPTTPHTPYCSSPPSPPRQSCCPQDKVAALMFESTWQDRRILNNPEVIRFLRNLFPIWSPRVLP